MVRALGEAEGKPLFKISSRVLYSRLGYLLYVREQTLVAQPFDADTQAVTGEPIPVGEGLGVDNAGGAAFSLSAGGVLVYRSGVQTGRRLVWMDRRGKESPALEDIRDYGDTWLSPDGARLAFDMAEGGGKGDIWIRDLARGVTSRFTFDPEREFAPLWSPDGRSIVYAKITGTSWDLYVKDAAGTGEGKVLLANTLQKFPTDWSKDGRYLIYNESGKDTTWDLWALPMTGDNRTPIALNATRFSEFGGSLSPDGKYLAYRSNESGRNQVYVQEFPEARSKWQVSVNGGADPFWKADGRELYYRAPDLSIMAVPVQAGATFSTGTPEALFRARFSLVNSRGLYRVTPDGQRFLVLATPGRDAIPPATVVLNWTAALQ